MSRRIKVRAWDTRDKKYLYSEKQDFICTTHSDGLGVTIPYHKDVPGLGVDNFDEDCFDWADADLLMGRYELEEFTGLLDKNGKEIYEGDIIRWTDDYDENGYIDFGDGCFLVNWSINSERINGDMVDDLEVIGNIHENPELLGGEE